MRCVLVVYLPVKIERLDLAKCVAARRAGGLRVVGSAYQLLDAERRDAALTITPDGIPAIEMGHDDADVLTLLRQRWNR